MTAQAALWFALSYLVGAFPTSLIAGKLVRGIDLREHGSRNLGATNVYRVLGWKVAVPVALVDIAKGAIPVLFFAPRVSSSLSVVWLRRMRLTGAAYGIKSPTSLKT